MNKLTYTENYKHLNYVIKQLKILANLYTSKKLN